MRVSCLCPPLEKPQHENLMVCAGKTVPPGQLSGREGGGRGCRRSRSLGEARAARVRPSSPQSSRDSPKVTKRVRKKQSVPGSGPNKQNPIKKKKMTLGTRTKKPGYKSTLHSCRLIFLKCKWDAPRSSTVPFRGPGAPGGRLSPRPAQGQMVGSPTTSRCHRQLPPHPHPVYTPGMLAFLSSLCLCLSPCLIQKLIC